MFQRVQACNLFSWEKLDYKIYNGVSQITGYNYDDNSAEGSGKSSCLNVLCWALYGAIPKDVKVDEVIREGQASGWASVECESGAKIYRSRKPNTLYMISSDGVRIEGKDAKETQKIINNFVGMDFDTFCQVAYFSQSYYKKFIAANEADKAKILSEIQDITVFDDARKKVMEDMKGLEVSCAIEQRQVDTLAQAIRHSDESIELIESQIALFNGKLTERKAALKQKESRILESLDQAEGQLASLKGKVSGKNSEMIIQLCEEADVLKLRAESLLKDQREFDKNQSTFTRYKSTIKRLEQSINLKQERLTQAEKHSDTCPTCKSKVKEEQKEEVFSGLRQLREELVALAEEYRDTVNNPVIEPTPFDNAEYTEIVDTINILNENIRELRLQESSLQAKIGSKEKESYMFRRQLQELIAEEAALEKENTDLLEDKLVERRRQKATDLKNIEHKTQLVKDINIKILHLEILKDGFKELKSYVFQSLLRELSRKSTELAREMFEVPVSIVFTNTSEEGGVAKIQTEVTLDGHTRSLGLFSGGQFKRLELSVDLALSHIVSTRSQKPLKFRIFDEPFKDLSESSISRIINLLKRQEGATILIEHNPIAKAIVDRVFHVEYRAGVSTHANSDI